MKTYKVVPFVPTVTIKETSNAVAQSLERVINDIASQGWTFESIEKLETTVNDPGCMGFNAKSATNFLQLIVFSK